MIVTQLSPHFSVSEMSNSDTAIRLGIDNSIPDELMSEAYETADMMERIREFLSEKAGKTIRINVLSGYRSIDLNRALGSKDSSDHVKMLAVDFRANDFGTPFAVCRELAPHINDLGIGQLIYEFKSWIHVSRNMGIKPINRVITYAKGYPNPMVGIVET